MAIKTAKDIIECVGKTIVRAREVGVDEGYTLFFDDGTAVVIVGEWNGDSVEIQVKDCERCNHHELFVAGLINEDQFNRLKRQEENTSRIIREAQERELYEKLRKKFGE